MNWNFDINLAPKDRPILVKFDHDADPYVDPYDGKKLTVYSAFCEGGSFHKGKGYCVAAYGGGIDQDESGEGWGPWTYIPDWWFDANSGFEIAVNPVAWCLIEGP